MEGRSGFSLIELVVVVVIFAVIAAIAIPRVSSATESARMNAQHRGFLAIERALEAYYADFGDWPPNTNHLVTPEPLRPYLHGLCFSSKPPLGAEWDWNGPGSGVNTHGVNLAVRSHDPGRDARYLEFDKRFDDGSLSTGLYRRDRNSLVRIIRAP